MRFQPKVNAAGLKSEMWYALGFWDAASIFLTGDELEVTSLVDQHEEKPSLHNDGNAGDGTGRRVEQAKRRLLYEFLRLHLDPKGFDTVLEAEHIHVERDPKPGERFIGQAEE